MHYTNFNTSNVKVYHIEDDIDQIGEANFNTSNVKVYPDTQWRLLHLYIDFNTSNVKVYRDLDVEYVVLAEQFQYI